MDVNHYATKKSVAQGMLDVALLTANSSQMTMVLHAGPQYPFYTTVMVLLLLSITLQLVVGLLLVFIMRDDLKDEQTHARLDQMNNAATVCVLFIIPINIFIAAFGFQGSTFRPVSDLNVTRRL